MYREEDLVSWDGSLAMDFLFSFHGEQLTSTLIRDTDILEYVVVT